MAFAATGSTNVARRAFIGERAVVIPYFRMSKAGAASLHPPRPGSDPAMAPPLPCYGPAILRLAGYYELDYGSFLLGMKRALELSDIPPPDNLRSGAYLAHVGEASMKRQRTLSGLFMSGYASVVRHEDEGIALQHLALTALAIENFARDTGRLPEKLQELTPKYLAEMPQDPFTGLEVEYRRKEGEYLVYSVGPDQKDNAGLEGASEKQTHTQPVRYYLHGPTTKSIGTTEGDLLK